MNARILCTVFVLISAFTARAALIPYYQMDSLALMSDAIVLCEEKDIQFKEIRHDEKWIETKTVVNCMAVRTFKGDIKERSEVHIEYDPIFRRYLQFKGGYSEVNAAGTVRKVIPPEYIPPGRALLFLKKIRNSDSYHVVDAKLIQGESVLQFGQFESNPGPLVLAPQKPENIKLSVTQKYGESQLIEDLLLALKQSLSLKEPKRTHALEALK